MRRTFLLAVFCWAGYLAGLAQGEIIVVREQFRNISLADAMEQLEKIYGLQIAYDNDLLSGITIDRSINGLPLQEALRQLLEPASLDFQLLSPREILIRPADSRQISNRLISIQGEVIDALNGAPLPYAAILLAGSTTGTAANEYGRFELSVSTAKAPFGLRVQYVGYHPLSLTISPEQCGKFQKLRLAPQVQEIEPVTVSGRPAVVSTRQDGQSLRLDAGQLSRLPAFLGGNDLFRQMQLLPGISAHDDLSAGLKIRGGGADENMILLDGITLYNIDHFFGVFSAINPELIKEVKLYKNAFPAEFGGRTAGVVEMTSKSPAQDKLHGSAEINLLMGNAYLAAPLSDKMSLSFGGRITGQDVADTKLYGLIHEEDPPPVRMLSQGAGAPSSNLITAEPDFYFYDAYARWAWKPSESSSWSAGFFHSYDDFNYQYQQEYYRRFQNRPAITRETYQESADWANTGFNLQEQQQWTPELQSQFRLGYSSFQTQSASGTSITRPLRNDSLITLANGQSNRIEGWEFNWKNEWRLSGNTTLAGGYNFLKNKVNFELDIERAPLLADRQSANQHTLFLEHRQQWNGKLSSTLGLRTTYYQPDGKVYPSPRLQLNYQIHEDWSLKGALSRYNQFLREMNYEDRFGRSFDFWVLADNAEFPIAHANQAMMGFNWRKNGFELDVEAYAKQTEGVVAYALLAPGFLRGNMAPGAESEYRLFRGNGQSTGIDILLKKDWGPYSGWLAYTLSKTTQRFPQINRNQPFPSQDDRRHQLKWANMLRLGRWEFSAAYIFASGRPFTDLARFQQQQDRREIDIEDFITYLPDYHRADAEIGYNFPLSGLRARAGLAVFNLFDHENIKYRQYIYSLSPEESHTVPQNVVLGNEVKLLGRTLNVSFSVRF